MAGGRAKEVRGLLGAGTISQASSETLKVIRSKKFNRFKELLAEVVKDTSGKGEEGPKVMSKAQREELDRLYTQLSSDPEAKKLVDAALKSAGVTFGKKGPNFRETFMDAGRQKLKTKNTILDPKAMEKVDQIRDQSQKEVSGRLQRQAAAKGLGYYASQFGIEGMDFEGVEDVGFSDLQSQTGRFAKELMEGPEDRLKTFVQQVGGTREEQGNLREAMAQAAAGNKDAINEIRMKFTSLGQQQISGEEGDKTEGEKVGGEIAKQMQDFNKENIQVLKSLTEAVTGKPQA